MRTLLTKVEFWCGIGKRKIFLVANLGSRNISFSVQILGLLSCLSSGGVSVPESFYKE